MSGRTAADRRADLVALYRELGPDHVCPLKDSRANIVFGMGNADADLMFVGEAPGATEDQEGKPFVGRAGKLLDTLLVEIGLDRGQVFIANVLKCRPPGNRDPLPEEIAECEPYLMRQVELIRPRVICTLGNFSTKLLSGSPVGITKVRGVPQEREIAGVPVKLFPLFHPAAALRVPRNLELLREDFANIPALLEEERQGGEQRPDEPAPEGPEGPAGEAPQLDLFG
ncbi:MAG: uracil-DNA glycosylase [Thermoleophilaceae bacterium]|nr:uracil-DNA glycosylase [Thermoleophilaceae bacterium]